MENIFKLKPKLMDKNWTLSYINQIQIQFFKGAFNNKIALSEKTENMKKSNIFATEKDMDVKISIL